MSTLGKAEMLRGNMEQSETNMMSSHQDMSAAHAADSDAREHGEQSLEYSFGMASPLEDDAVLLIHGTFAAADTDEGTAWWQHGSTFSRALRGHLSRWSATAQELPPFRWSGRNSDRDRWKAAGDLLDRLRELERRQIHYHVVAHSHGGSVLWAALTLSLSGRKKNHEAGELRYLRSLATVGTPFLRHFPLGARLVSILRDVLVLAFGVALVVSSLALYGEDTWLRAVFFIATGFVGALLAIGGLIRLLTTMITFLELAVEYGDERRAMLTYGPRWLSLWSPDDEAINGLRSTIDNKWINLPAHDAVIATVFRADRSVYFLRRVMAPATRLWVALYNALLLPLIESIVRNNVSRAFQGNDRPATKIVQVIREPTIRFEESPSLPEVICTALRERADRAVTYLVPTLRPLLAQFALSGDPVVALHESGLILSGHELVHTSYFEHEDVQKLLAFHVVIHSVNRSGDMQPKMPTYLNDWYTRWQHYLNKALSEFSRTPKFIPAELAKRMLKG